MISCFCGKKLAIEPVPNKFWCPECPKFTCDKCGGENGYDVICKCWTSLENMNLADLKGIFALMDLEIDNGFQQP